MLWYRLWRALRNPSNFPHQLIKYETRQLHPILWIGGLTIMPFAVLPGLFLVGTAYSIQWAIEIADAIASTQEHSQFNLLGVLPGGQLAARWNIAINRMGSRYKQPDSQELWAVRIIICTFLVHSLRGSVESSAQVPAEIAIYGLCYLMLALEHYTSVVIGPLVGMLMPGDGNKDRLSLALLSGGITLGLIFSTAFIAMLAGWFVFIPLTTSVAGLVLTLLLFYLLREGVIHILWQTLLEKSNAPATALIDQHYGKQV